jgi:hypothetical protein
MAQQIPKRHHVIPKLLLRNFTEDPGDKRSLLWRLDLASGKIHQAGRDNVAVIKHYYSVEGPSGERDPAPEVALSQIEGHVGPIIQGIVEPGGRLRRKDRFALGAFIALLYRRTPRGRSYLNFIDRQVSNLLFDLSVSDTHHFHQDMAELNPDRSPEEIETLRAQMRGRINRGEQIFSSTPDRELGMMFWRLESMAGDLAGGFEWTILRAAAQSQFVLSDAGLAIVDADPGQVDRGLSFASSPTVETTLPLSPTTCLVLWPKTPSGLHLPPGSLRRIACVERPATDQEVQSINLRSLAWSGQAVYASGAAALSPLKGLAKRNAALVKSYRPRGPKIWVGEERDGQAEWTGYAPDD